MNFQPEKESWQSYAERLDHFFTANNVLEDDQKVSKLILENDPSVYTLLKELSFPIDPKQLTYNEVMATLERHFVGVKNIFNERKIFYRAFMQPSETASEWHRRLKSLAIHCEFGEFLDDILVDKFVCGFKGKVFQRLCEEDTHLNLLDAVKIAQLHEKVSEAANKLVEQKTNNQQQQRVAQNQSQKQQQQQGKQQQQQNHQPQQKQPQQQFGHVQNNQQQFVKPQNQQSNQRPVSSQNQRSHSQTRSRLQQHSGQQHFEQQHNESQILQQQQQRKPQHSNQQKQTQYHIVTQAPKKVPINCSACGKVGHHANVCRNKPECCLS